jgi:hypothetical protein
MTNIQIGIPFQMQAGYFHIRHVSDSCLGMKIKLAMSLASDAHASSGATRANVDNRGSSRAGAADGGRYRDQEASPQRMKI